MRRESIAAEKPAYQPPPSNSSTVRYRGLSVTAHVLRRGDSELFIDFFNAPFDLFTFLRCHHGQSHRKTITNQAT